MSHEAKQEGEDNEGEEEGGSNVREYHYATLIKAEHSTSRAPIVLEERFQALTRLFTTCCQILNPYPSYWPIYYPGLY